MKPTRSEVARRTAVFLAVRLSCLSIIHEAKSSMLPLDLEHVRKAPAMWVGQPTYAKVTAFLLGIDVACQGGLLVGLHEWLVVEYKDRYHEEIQTNVVWWENIRKLLIAQLTPSEIELGDDAIERLLIDRLFNIIDAYYETRSQGEGLRKIFVRFQNWLKRQDWYDPKVHG